MNLRFWPWMSHIARPPATVNGCAGLDPLEHRRLLSGSGLSAAYFARTNYTLDKFARVDETVDFNWSKAPPAKSLGTDGFSVRWVGQVQPKYSETYTFRFTSRGGEQIWVNNQLIINAASNHTQRTDSGAIALKAGQLYQIRIDYWSAGTSPGAKLEWQSNRQTRQVVPSSRLYPLKLDTTSPSAPTHLRSTTTGANTVSLAWDSSKDSSGVVAYDVYVGSSKVATTAPGQLSYVRTGLTPQTGYTFAVQALDAAANTSVQTKTAITTAPPPNRAPSVPGALGVSATSETSVTINWSASTDADGTVTGYRIYRNGTKLNVAVTGTSFTDTGLASDTAYTYTVRAADDDGLFSASSNAVATRTTIPIVITHDPFGTIPAASYDSSSGVSVSGQDLVSLDDGDFVRYRNVQFGSTGAKSVFFDVALPTANRGGRFELHLDSAGGTLVGTLNLQATGSFNTFFTQQTNISSVSGTHDLYIVFKGRSDMAHLRSVDFNTQKLIRIMALGDSITQQQHTSVSYRYDLWHMLKDEGYMVDFVGSQTAAYDGDPPNLDFDQDHEGHSGYRADEIASNIRAWFTANPADIVLLHIGTNDIRQGYGPTNPIDDIQSIISTIRSINPDVKILLAQIIPALGFEDQVDQFNALIPGLAASLNTAQSPIIVVDQHSGFSDVTDTVDGFHPTSDGDEKLAVNWMNALRSILA